MLFGGYFYMNTYLVQSGTAYKIGRTTNVNQRFGELSYHNFEMKMISFVNKNIEKELHRKYKEKRIKNEWFSLNDKDVDYILNLFNNPSINEIEYKDYIIKFGRYEGRYLISMSTTPEIEYIKHLSFSNIDVPYFKHWYENHLRYINIITCDKFHEKPINALDEYNSYLKKSELKNNQKLELIIKLGNELNLKTIPDYAKEKGLSYNGVKNNRYIRELFGVKFVIDNL